MHKLNSELMCAIAREWYFLGLLIGTGGTLIGSKIIRWLYKPEADERSR